MGSQARNRIRDSIEDASLLDPLELDDLRAANSELTATHLMEVFEEEEPADPVAHLAVTKEKLEAVTEALEKQKAETEKLKHRIGEVEEEKQVIAGLAMLWIQNIE